MVINGAPYSTNRLENPGLVPIVPACSRSDGWGAASGRLRRSRPPAQDCGRQTATLGPNVQRNGSTPTGLRPKRRSRLRPGRNRFAVQSLLRPFPGWASFHSADPGLEAVSPSGLLGDDHPALPRAGLFRPVGAGNRPATIAGRLWEIASITGPSIGRFGTDKQTPPGVPNANGFTRPRAQPLPDAYGGPVLQPRIAVARPLPWDPTSNETVQPQRGCAPNAVPASVQAGTALRFNRYSARSQGGPHSIRPTLGWRP